MNNREIQITNKNLIESTHKSEHEPYEYYKYEVTRRIDTAFFYKA